MLRERNTVFLLIDGTGNYFLRTGTPIAIIRGFNRQNRNIRGRQVELKYCQKLLQGIALAENK